MLLKEPPCGCCCRRFANLKCKMAPKARRPRLSKAAKAAESSKKLLAANAKARGRGERGGRGRGGQRQASSAASNRPAQEAARAFTSLEQHCSEEHFAPPVFDSAVAFPVIVRKTLSRQELEEAMSQAASPSGSRKQIRTAPYERASLPTRTPLHPGRPPLSH